MKLKSRFAQEFIEHTTDPERIAAGSMNLRRICALSSTLLSQKTIASMQSARQSWRNSGSSETLISFRFTIDPVRGVSLVLESYTDLLPNRNVNDADHLDDGLRVLPVNSFSDLARELCC
jgi:hypothetical protein